jgi:hypothetical protein
MFRKTDKAIWWPSEEITDMSEDTDKRIAITEDATLAAFGMEDETSKVAKKLIEGGVAPAPRGTISNNSGSTTEK